MRQVKSALRLWPVPVVSTLLLFAYAILRPSNVYSRTHPSKSLLAFTNSSLKKHDFDNLQLSEERCQVTFPYLTREIDRAVAQGPFQLGLEDASASLLAQVKDNKMLIIRAPRPVDMSDQWRERQWAALHQINRAILTSPNLLPDTVFNLYIQDTPVSHSWSHSRPATSLSPKHIFAIPPFAFWTWNQPFIRSIPTAALAISEIEATLPFHEKDRRAVWRGTAWFNNCAGENPRSRQELLKITKDESWADVQALEWVSNGENAMNALKISDFCRYKYIIHTEGVSYSGRLQFHQMCESVVVSPPIEWMQHTTHLVKPVYSSLLLRQGVVKSGKHVAAERYDYSGSPSTRARATWPATVCPEEANMVFVDPDWSDLEATISWLEEHPEVSHDIAPRQRALFVESGYLSPAAEVCYWRALVRGWSRVARADNSVCEDADVTTWEEFSVRHEMTQKRQ